MIVAEATPMHLFQEGNFQQYAVDNSATARFCFACALERLKCARVGNCPQYQCIVGESSAPDDWNAFGVNVQAGGTCSFSPKCCSKAAIRVSSSILPHCTDGTIHRNGNRPLFARSAPDLQIDNIFPQQRSHLKIP
ncbi:hypothetical protein T11_5469 [Trichinella zimbabwensis]|uniref:Uncharacterized protein n=1 Tax=Trichinella zimbabwensis TaxID=268475 RepID=A0A0V1I8A7_9BILA|nr:hypothetical protein T11_5469 [Trichinella zimbabwensis]